MNSMFTSCESLEALYIDNFNTIKVTNMKMMFYELTNLKYLNLSSFISANCNNYANIFDLSYNLTIRIQQYKCFNIISNIPKYINVEYSNINH